MAEQPLSSMRGNTIAAMQAVKTISTMFTVTRKLWNILEIQSVPGVFSSALGDVGYIFRTEHEPEVLEITSFIHEL